MLPCPGRKPFSSKTQPWSWKKSLCFYFWLCLWLCWHYPFLWWCSYAIYTRGLERSWHVSVLLSSASCIGWRLERNLSACLSDDSYAVYTKGLERSWLGSVMYSLLPSWGLERSLGACACSHGLDRTGSMVLIGLRCNSLVSQVMFCHLFTSNGLERHLLS